MPANDFPLAVKRQPVYVIDGKFYERAAAKDAMDDPQAIRARVAKSDGEVAVAWFRLVAVAGANEVEGGEQAES